MYHRKDAYYRKAKAEGYRSRAAYKLLDMARRYRLICRGDHVVELGAWPGGWLQVAEGLAGRTGRVVGVDLRKIEIIPGGVVRCVRGDARDEGVQEEIVRLSDGRIDVVLCDMAPKLTGVRARDEVRAAELATSALAFARRTLAVRGRFLMKVFSSPADRALLRDARRSFRTAKLTRPAASRKGSGESYLVGVGALPRETP